MSRRRTQADRFRALLTLLPYLRRGSTLSVAHLAEVVGATREQIVEDVLLLSMVGIPPYTPDELIDVWLSEDDAEVRVVSEPPALGRTVRLTGPETRALTAALEACGTGPDDGLFAKLVGSTEQTADAADVAHLVRAAIAPAGTGGVNAAVARAIGRCEAIGIEYFSAGRGTIAQRVIRPYVLEFRRGAWYVSAFCELAGEDRVFRLDRIRNVEVTGRTFQPPAKPPRPEPDLTGRADLRVAEIEFAASSRLPDERQWPGAEFEQRPDGSTLARVPFDGVEWLARRVAARLGDARVLAPEELRRAVATTASAVVANEEAASEEKS